MRNRIYIVEDEVIVAQDIRQILVSAGFQVMGLATNYTSALHEIPEIRPDIVLCDINLNGAKTGISLIRELQEMVQFRTIFITAYSDLQTIQESNLVNPFNYLTKPFNTKQLVASVQLASISLDDLSGGNVAPSRRELTIISLLAKGLNSEEIATRLFISKNTVDTHRRHLLKKFSAKSTSELVALAIGQRWI
jgi:DNA-binding NarL/FixJ family response regulator